MSIPGHVYMVFTVINSVNQGDILSPFTLFISQYWHEIVNIILNMLNNELYVHYSYLMTKCE